MAIVVNHRNRRGLVWAVAFLIWLTATANGRAFQASHDLVVSIEPGAARISGTDHIRLEGGPEGMLAIGLNPRVQITSLQINGTAQAVITTVNGPAVDLSKFPAGDPIELLVHYNGQFRDKAPVRPANTDNPGYGVSGTISPRGTLLLGGAGWYPAIDAAVESVRLEVRAPEGMRAVSAGRLLGFSTQGGQTISRWQIDPPIERLALSVGRYITTTSHEGRVPVSTYFLSDDGPLAATYLEASIDYIALYEAKFGAYPFPKFAVVENFFPTGYGFPSYTLIGGRVLRLPFIVRTSLGHEIAHCWWGNGVRVDARDGNWSEGLTSYVAEHHYQEVISEEAGQRHRQQLLRNYATLVAPEKDFPLRRFSHRYSPLTKAVGYDKSAMVFHMLRQTVGDQAFQEGLRHLYKTRLHQATGWDDLRRAFEFTSGMNLDWFFAQWLDKAGAPTLELDDVRVRVDSPGQYVVSGVLRQGDSHYRLQVPLTLAGQGFRIDRVLDVRSPSTPFEIRTSNPPRRLAADPATHIFRRLAPAEIPPSINGLRRRAPLVIVVSGDDISPYLKDLGETLGRALGRSAISFMREKDLDPDQLTADDMLIFGRPRHSLLLKDAVAANVIMGKDDLRLDDQTYATDVHSFFGVWRHPTSRSSVLAVWVPGRHSDHEAIARKIPHYGRYSYLVFERSQNRAKGIWPPASTPLVHTWPVVPTDHAQ